MTYEDLQGKDSTFENTPGTEQVIYFAPISDFRYVASPKEFVNVDDYGDATLIGVADDDHLLKQGKKWTRLSVLMGTGSVAGETVGDRGSRAVKTSVECFYVGGTKQIYGLQRVIKEGKYVVLAPHANGDVQQIGRLKKPALINISTSTGKEEEGAKGATISIEAIDAAGWIYEGDIPTTVAV